MQLNEEGGVAGHADQQRAVLVRMRLRAAQRLLLHHVELHVVDGQVEEAAQVGGKALQPLLPSQDLRART